MLDFFKSLFANQSPKAAEIPFLHEAIDVKAYPVDAWDNWRQSEVYESIRDVVRKGLSDVLITGKFVTSEFSMMKSSHANGWLIPCQKHDFTDVDYKHFAYTLYRIINELGYTLNLAEVRSQKRAGNIESVTKYYLKPSLRHRFSHDGDSNLANQLYGNITIEYKSINGLPYEFKLVVHAYQDSKYLPPKDYNDLVEKLIA